MSASKPALSNSFFINLREAAVLLELRGSSEMKAGVSGVCEHVSLDPDKAFNTFQPLQFTIHTICVPVSNNLCCYKPEPHGPICSVCTHPRAILPT